MEMKLEVVCLPVTDPDRSKKFYEETVGFKLDHDVQPGNGMRVIQLTPPGSACSIVFGTGMGLNVNDGTVKNIHLVVGDIAKVRTALLDRGLKISDINDMGGVLFANFSDPDGNTWVVQQIYNRSI